MTISTVVTALQGIHQGITGVTSTPTTMPSALNSGLLPIALVWPGECEWRVQTPDMARRERDYAVRCYCQAVGQGAAGSEEGYALANGLLDDFGEAYMADLSLGNTVDHLSAVRDSGVVRLTWGDTEYWGFEFHVVVVEKG